MKNKKLELIEVTDIPVFTSTDNEKDKNDKSTRRNFIEYLKTLKEDLSIALDELTEGIINENNETVMKK